MKVLFSTLMFTIYTSSLKEIEHNVALLQLQTVSGLSLKLLAMFMMILQKQYLNFPTRVYAKAVSLEGRSGLIWIWNGLLIVKKVSVKFYPLKFLIIKTNAASLVASMKTKAFWLHVQSTKKLRCKKSTQLMKANCSASKIKYY